MPSVQYNLRGDDGVCGCAYSFALSDDTVCETGARVIGTSLLGAYTNVEFLQICDFCDDSDIKFRI